MASLLKLDSIQDVSGNASLDVAKIAGTTSRYIRQSIVHYDTTTYNFSTTWAAGTYTPTYTMKAGSLIKVFLHVPGRNDSTGWGGGYNELQWSVAGASYLTLGSGGYDGGVMNNGNQAIGTWNNTYLLDPGQSSDFTVIFRTYHKSYDSTFTINGSHDINATSGSASGGEPNLTNINQHFMHMIIEEYALLRGDS